MPRIRLVVVSCSKRAFLACCKKASALAWLVGISIFSSGCRTMELAKKSITYPPGGYNYP